MYVICSGLVLDFDVSIKYNVSTYWLDWQTKLLMHGTKLLAFTLVSETISQIIVRVNGEEKKRRRGEDETPIFWLPLCNLVNRREWVRSIGTPGEDSSTPARNQLEQLS